MGSIKNKVNQLISKYGTSDPFELVKLMDITVVNEYLGDSLGYFSKVNRTVIIHINENLSYEKQLYTLMHELGHVVLHPELNTAFLKTNTFCTTDRYEVEANLFAVALLFHQGGDRTITVKEATESYGIPKQLLMKNFYA